MVTTMVIKQSYSQVDSCHRLEVSECIQLTVVLQYVGVNSMFVPGKHHDCSKVYGISYGQTNQLHGSYVNCTLYNNIITHTCNSLCTHSGGSGGGGGGGFIGFRTNPPLLAINWMGVRT